MENNVMLLSHLWQIHLTLIANLCKAAVDDGQANAWFFLHHAKRATLMTRSCERMQSF